MKTKILVKRTLPALAVLAAIGFCGLAFGGAWVHAQSAAAPNAQGTPNRSSPVNVTSIVHDWTDSTDSTPTLLRSDDYNATGQASYDTGSNVLSQIFGFWYLVKAQKQTHSPGGQE